MLALNRERGRFMKNHFTGVERTIRCTQRAITGHPPASGGQIETEKLLARDFVFYFPSADTHAPRVEDTTENKFSSNFLEYKYRLDPFLSAFSL